MLADIKGPHLDFLGGPTAFYTALSTWYTGQARLNTFKSHAVRLVRGNIFQNRTGQLTSLVKTARPGVDNKS